MKCLKLVALTMGLSCFTSMAMAQQVAQPSGLPDSDISAFHGNQRSLVHAIRQVEKVSGGRVLEIRFAMKDEEPGYHAVVLHKGQISYVHVDEKSGHVVALAERSRPSWMNTWEKRAPVKVEERAKVPLAKAIMTAEAAYNNSPAVAAGLAGSATDLTTSVKAYNILLDIDGHTKRVAIDDNSGQVIADPQLLSD